MTFSSVVDFEDREELPADALVMGETPSNPARVILAVAHIRKAEVRLPEDDEEWPAISNG